MYVSGGTPYGNVKSRDVGNRVTRGMRVPQTQYMTDDIYQVMLQCWQLDLDERPTFRQIEGALTHLLEELMTKQASHISFEIGRQGFRYEDYSNDLEFIS